MSGSGLAGAEGLAVTLAEALVLALAEALTVALAPVLALSRTSRTSSNLLVDHVHRLRTDTMIKNVCVSHVALVAHYKSSLDA